MATLSIEEQCCEGEVFQVTKVYSRTLLNESYRQKVRHRKIERGLTCLGTGQVVSRR
jgi:hypothetical protein